MINKKRCYIHTNHPITCFIVPIVGDTELNLTHEEIYKCLCAKAEVIEILYDGRRINLDFSNYDKNNDWTLVSNNEPIGGPYVGGTPEPIKDMTFKGEVPEAIPAVLNISEDIITEETVEESVEEEIVEIIEQFSVVDEDPVVEEVESELTVAEVKLDEENTTEEVIEEIESVFVTGLTTASEEKDAIKEVKAVSAKTVTATSNSYNKNNNYKKSKNNRR